MLSKKAIEEYQAIHKKEFGVEISEQEAQEQGMKLLRLFKLIYQPIPKKWIIKNSEKKKGGEEKNGTK